jgi:3-hydroxypropanoate dehydrogenase
MSATVSLDDLFTEARSQRKFLDKPIPPGTLENLYDQLKWGPTSMNCSPARFAFARSIEARTKLAGCAAEGNRERILVAPATVIIANDQKFFDQMSKLVPHNPDAGNRFRDNETLASDTAFRNGTLQGAYLMLAARSLGLDCAPMSGFDADAVDASFFAQDNWKSNFICCLGYGDKNALHPRAPRLEFDEACVVL